MEAELTALAASAATALVGLMVTEGWGQAKARVARFFARRQGSGDSGEDRDELDDARRELEEARGRGDDAGAARVEALLRERIGELLTSEAGAEHELRRLLAELGPPAAQAAISGGAQYGPVVTAASIQGGITFTVPPPPETGSAVKPDQVPAQTVNFINRTADLSVLRRWLAGDGGTSSRVGVSVLDGLPGVGKTATAKEYAHRCRDLYPDGQIYVDFAALRAEGHGGGDVSEAVRSGLRALGVGNEHIPESLADRMSLFRTKSAGRRLLVVLDDVNQPAQVRALVPKEPGSAVLVTSNVRLGELAALDGARLLSLSPLDPDSALRLLKDRLKDRVEDRLEDRVGGPGAVDAELPAAERLVEHCGRLPVALHIVASRLNGSPGLSLSRLADALDDERNRLAGLSLRGEISMSAVLGDAYRQLPPDAARVFRLLGWLPGRAFDAGTVSAVADVPTEAARPLLAQLLDASLLEEWPDSDGRYRMHDLVRLYARERADEEEPQAEHLALIDRVAAHYLTLTAFADRALRADRLRIADLEPLLARAPDPFTAPGAPEPLHWLEAERAEILAALREASRCELHTRVWQLAEAFTALFLNHRHLGEWRESLELGAAAAAAAVVPAAEARLRSLLSRPLMDLGEYDRACAELEAADACAEIADHTVLRASVLEFTGRYWDRFDPPRAVASYRQALELNTSVEEERGAAIALLFLGQTQSGLDDQGARQEALESLREARRRLTALGDRRMAARATLALGITYARLGDPDEAAASLRAAADVLNELGAHHYEAQALVALADVEEQTGAGPEVVREHLARALAIYEAGGSPKAEEIRARLRRPGGDGGDGGGSGALG
ncbi:ATP-binding protein [Streptomyces sp. NPDC002851]